MTYISLTKHSIEQAIIRNPEINGKKYTQNVKDAKMFLENLLRKWLSNRNEGSNVSIKNWKEWKIILTDWVHKLVYVKVWIWELLIITYWYKDQMSIIEWELLRTILSNQKRYGNRYRRF